MGKGRERGAKEEREAVVKWLRDTAVVFEGYLKQTKATDKDRCIEYAIHRDSCRWAAKAIEKGEHRI